MKARLLFLVKYFLFWLVFFQSARALFMAYHHHLASSTPYSELLAAFGYGLRLDISFAAYLSVLPFLIATISIWVSNQLYIKRVFSGYVITVLWVCVLLVIMDLEIFSAWGIRLDATPLMYLSTPSEIFASAYSSPLLLLLVLFIISFSLWIWLKGLYLKLELENTTEESLTSRLYYSLGLLLLTGCLIIPIRGGLQSLPINQSSAYFSQSVFANKAAINVCWNFFHAVTERSYDMSNPYIVENEHQKVEQLYDKSYQQGSTEVMLLDSTIQKPNVIVIIWESLTSKLLGKATPNLMQTMRESYYFDNIYATGSRSDKGIVGVLSGYPAQPQKSIILYPNKSRKLPILGKDMHNNGYQTSFYYGGELEFVNMKSYLFECFDNVYGINSFAPEDRNSKWGAHDHVVLDKVLQDTPDDAKPFFKTIFTLSSHEPFEVPDVFTDFADFEDFTEEEALFANSHRYTDWSVNQFLNKAKQKKWWKNTIVIIVADHGHHFPAYQHPEDHVDFEDFKIPLLFSGGALSKAYHGQVNHRIGSQTDVAKTLLSQLQIKASDYVFSRNLLAASSDTFAVYAYSDGIGYVSENERFIFDNNSKRVLKAYKADQKYQPTDAILNRARHHLQWTFQDFLSK
ncbi:MAG: alkaline phosphatase family protein [Cytophagales bacterium]|nr:MAG: alkaline phosphatase family protein [Cytophagales bacterium]TAF59860.1 MAG: alkaline phosphatase family protein [Cytophagales bacterium]